MPSWVKRLREPTANIACDYLCGRYATHFVTYQSGPAYMCSQCSSENLRGEKSGYLLQVAANARGGVKVATAT